MSYWSTSKDLTIILHGIHELHEHGSLAAEKLKSQSFGKLQYIKMLHSFVSPGSTVMWNIHHMFKLCRLIYACACVCIYRERERELCHSIVLKPFADIL